MRTTKAVATAVTTLKQISIQPYCDSDDHDTDGESSTQRPCNNMPHTTLQQHAAYNIQNTAVRCLASVLLPR